MASKAWAHWLLKSEDLAVNEYGSGSSQVRGGERRLRELYFKLT